MMPVFYAGTKNASSWAMRAWLALREVRYEFEERIVDIRKPQRFQNLALIGAFAPSASVPALVTDKAVIFDSLAIMEFANEIGEGILLPRDVEVRARARAFVAWQHAGLSQICARISFESAFYPLKREFSANEAREVSRLCEIWERELDRSRGPFLFGDLSLADLAFVPTVVKLEAHQLDCTLWPRVAAWVPLLLNRPLVREWIAEAMALPHIWFDEYLIPGDPLNWKPSDREDNSQISMTPRL